MLEPFGKVLPDTFEFQLRRSKPLSCAQSMPPWIAGPTWQKPAPNVCEIPRNPWSVAIVIFPVSVYDGLGSAGSAGAGAGACAIAGAMDTRTAATTAAEASNSFFISEAPFESC